MNRIVIKLKQHTPLLHFQPMQEGATLRASEVKPKLDKFLHSKCLEEIPKEWCYEGTKAFKYQMKIVPVGDPVDVTMSKKVVKDKKTKQPIPGLFTTRNYPNDNNSIIMGNMGGRPEEELLNLVMYSSYDMILLTKEEGVSKLLSEYIADFFYQTCFGNRTSKGFGSFAVLKINGKPVGGSSLCAHDYNMSFKLEPKDDVAYGKGTLYQDVYVIINKIWKILKGNSGKVRGATDSPFLNLSLKTTDHSRVPSVIRFKPSVLKEEDSYTLNLGLIVDVDLPDYAASNSRNEDGFLQLYDYINGLIEKGILTDDIKNSLMEWDLSYDVTLSKQAEKVD